MYRPGRKAFALALVVASLGFHLITVALFSRQPDRFAAFTLFPIWIWGSFGLAISSTAFLFFRAPLSLFTSAAWAITILVLADETGSLLRVGVENTWLAASARRRGLAFVHHVGGRVPSVTAGVPALVTVHDLQPLDLGHHFSRVKRAYLGWAVPRSVRRAGLVLAPPA